MKTTKFFSCVAKLMALLFLPALVEAADNCSGHEVIVGGKHIIVNNNPSARGFPKIGECESSATGGSCKFTDVDGDEYNSEWTMVPGATRQYSWKTKGGTGKWAKANESGWAKTIMIEGSVSINRWGGECK